MTGCQQSCYLPPPGLSCIVVTKCMGKEGAGDRFYILQHTHTLLALFSGAQKSEGAPGTHCSHKHDNVVILSIKFIVTCKLSFQIVTWRNIWYTTATSVEHSQRCAMRTTLLCF